MPGRTCIALSDSSGDSALVISRSSKCGPESWFETKRAARSVRFWIWDLGFWIGGCWATNSGPLKPGEGSRLKPAESDSCGCNPGLKPGADVGKPAEAGSVAAFSPPQQSQFFFLVSES